MMMMMMMMMISLGFVPRHAQHRLKGLLDQIDGSDERGTGNSPTRTRTESSTERQVTININFEHHLGHFMKMRRFLHELTRLTKSGHAESRKESLLSIRRSSNASVETYRS
mmetsp:Transcript_16005/g.29571  ORF Transcript_16005/g.29571 Transcript_16005/m.29571 type:complete len:111 (-) Transcript_16005:33-365(-)